MKILYSDEVGTEVRAQGIRDVNQVWQRIETVVKADTPMYLGMVSAVTYSDKTDRYVAKFAENSTAKVTEEVAAYLIEHAVSKGGVGVPLPTVYAKMDSGVITDVTLLFSYKNNG
jgi:adenosylmethionine-8-amino-7-oxononanoate aminotransferase